MISSQGYSTPASETDTFETFDKSAENCIRFLTQKAQQTNNNDEVIHMIILSCVSKLDMSYNYCLNIPNVSNNGIEVFLEYRSWVFKEGRLYRRALWVENSSE